MFVKKDQTRVFVALDEISTTSRWSFGLLVVSLSVKYRMLAMDEKTLGLGLNHIFFINRLCLGLICVYLAFVMVPLHQPTSTELDPDIIL